MSSNQTQLGSNHLISKQLSSNSASLTSIRPVAGIGESPFRPKQTHPSASHLLSNTLNNSRLFKQLPSHQRSRTHLGTHLNHHHHSFQNTHRKNLSSDSSSHQSQHHPTPTLNQPNITLPIYHTYIRPENQELSGSRSIVASFGLAPISQSSNHQFGLQPYHHHHHPKDSLNIPTSRHGSSNHTRTSSDQLHSTSLGSSIPSLLNPSRVKAPLNDPPQIDPPVPPPPDELEITGSDRAHQQTTAGLSSLPPLIPNNPFQIDSTCPSGSKRKADPELFQPPHPQHSYPLPIASNHFQPPQLAPSSEHDLSANTSRQTPQPAISFEPSGNSFCKYALPKPRLEVNLLPEPLNLTQQSMGERKSRKNLQKPVTETCPAVFFPYKTPTTAHDIHTEELKDRYWNSKADNLGVHEIWAEIYISRLERKLWKAQAEADISSDCLAFCMPLGSNPTPLKPQNTRRRAASVPHAIKPRPVASSSRPRNHSQNKAATNKRGKFDFTSFHNNVSTDDKVRNKPISCQPSSPLEISDGSLHRLPCISTSHLQSTSVITPYRPDFVSPPTQSQSIFRSETNPRIIRQDAVSNLPRNADSERGYRIVLSTPTHQQHKSFRRRSRSVPDLRQIQLQLASSPDSTQDSAAFFGNYASKNPPELLSRIHRPWPSAEPTSQTTLSIPQTLLDAMFPPVSDSAANTTAHPPKNFISVDSSIRPVHCVMSPKDLHKSVCAAIEVPDNTFTSSRPNSAAAPNELSESLPKGPLHSLPRFVEPLPATVVALPPPPRKRNPTPVTPTHSSSQNSSVGTKRSTNESMVAHLSFATPSEKSGPEFSLPPSVRLARRSSSPLTPPEPRTEKVMPSSIHPAGLPFEAHQRTRRRSLSSVYPTSPTCESPVDSAYRYSGFLSQVSSRPCSLGGTVPWINREDRDQRVAFKPDRPPLSAIYLASTPPRPQKYSIGVAQPANTCMSSMNGVRDSSHSGGSGSSHSAIDPDKPINQADLFYQVPASPRRSLIQDYDDHILRSKQSADTQAEEGTPNRSVLIDEILAGYVGPRRAQMARSTRLQACKSPCEPLLNCKEDREEARSTESDFITSYAKSSQPRSLSTVPQKIPQIIDAFEARQTSRSRHSSHSQSN